MNLHKFRLSLDRQAFERAGFRESPDLSRCWVDSLSTCANWLVEAAGVHGIVDDGSFLQIEKKLDPNVRGPLWVARHVASYEDPWCMLDHLMSLPSWLRNTSLSDLPLTVRQSNVFRENALSKVLDLDQLGLSGLMSLERMGTRSVRQLNDILVEAMLKGPKPVTKKIKRAKSWTMAPQNGQFLIGIEDALSMLPSRSRSVVEARMGFRSEPRSLSSIGQELALTKEMVRLIERDACSLIANHAVFSIARGKTEAHVKDSGGWLDVNDLVAMDEWFTGVEGRESILEFILGKLFPSDFSISFISKSKFEETYSKLNPANSVERFFLSTIPSSQVLTFSATCSSLVQQAAENNQSESDLRLSIRALLEPDFVGALEAFYEKSTRSTTFSSSKRESTSRIANATDTALLEILEAAKAPMTWKEIEALLKPKIKVSSSYFRARLASLSMIFGRNSYGLMSHCPLSAEENEQIKAVVEDFVLCQSEDKQWHSQDFLDVCMSRQLSFSGKLDMYLINMALLSSARLQPLGRLVWAKKNNENSSARPRVGLQKTIESLLEKSGGPLSTDDLKRKIKEVRGVGPSFQVFPVGRIVQVGKSMWDLDQRN